MLDADTVELVCLEVGRSSVRVGRSKEASKKYIHELKKNAVKAQEVLDESSRKIKELRQDEPTEVEMVMQNKEDKELER